MTNVPPDLLADRVRSAAAGYYPSETAAELLIRHDRWLHRRSFVEACIEIDDGYAWVVWGAIPAFLDNPPGCSSSELRILAIVAELAGYDTGRPLGELLTSLDEHNSMLVLDAIAHVLNSGETRR